MRFDGQAGGAGVVGGGRQWVILRVARRRSPF